MSRSRIIKSRRIHSVERSKIADRRYNKKFKVKMTKILLLCNEVPSQMKTLIQKEINNISDNGCVSEVVLKYINGIHQK